MVSGKTAIGRLLAVRVNGVEHVTYFESNVDAKYTITNTKFVRLKYT